MPIYEYRCETCGEVTEEWQKINDPAPNVCPSCGAKGELHRLISQSSFVLKGTGWYATDFKDKPKNGDKSSSVSKHGVESDHKDTGKAETGSNTTASASDSVKAETAPSTSTAKPASPND